MKPLCSEPQVGYPPWRGTTWSAGAGRSASGERLPPRVSPCSPCSGGGTAVGKCRRSSDGDGGRGSGRSDSGQCQPLRVRPWGRGGAPVGQFTGKRDDNGDGGDRQERWRPAPATTRPPAKRRRAPGKAVEMMRGRHWGRRPARATAACACCRASAHGAAAGPPWGSGEEGGGAMGEGATGRNDGGQRLPPRIRP